MGSKKVGIFMGLFGTVGVLLMVWSGWHSLQAYNFHHNPEIREAPGVVVALIPGDTHNTFAPKVSFTKGDGVETFYESKSFTKSPDYFVGKEVSVLYLGSEYKIYSFDDLYGNFAIPGLVGLVFFLVGFGTITFFIYRQKTIKKLKTHGTPLKAVVTEIFINQKIKVNGRNPWKIAAESNENVSGVTSFYSDNIWFDPTEFVPIGKEVTVFLNMAKPKQYWLDTSFLPKE